MRGNVSYCHKIKQKGDAWHKYLEDFFTEFSQYLIKQRKF